MSISPRAYLYRFSSQQQKLNYFKLIALSCHQERGHVGWKLELGEKNSITQLVNQSINQLINQPFYQWIYQSVNKSTNHWNKQSTISSLQFVTNKRMNLELNQVINQLIHPVNIQWMNKSISQSTFSPESPRSFFGKTSCRFRDVFAATIYCMGMWKQAWILNMTSKIWIKHLPRQSEMKIHWNYYHFWMDYLLI